MTQLTQFNIIGGEYVDARFEESFVEFDYTVFAKDREDAIEMFNTIFPGCVMVRIK